MSKKGYAANYLISLAMMSYQMSGTKFLRAFPPCIPVNDSLYTAVNDFDNEDEAEDLSDAPTP